MMSKGFMDYANVTVQINFVFKENELKNPIVRHCTPHSNPDKVKGSFMSCIGIFLEPYISIPRVHITCKLDPCLI
jgi:hypothetical protein